MKCAESVKRNSERAIGCRVRTRVVRVMRYTYVMRVYTVNVTCT